MRDQVIYAAFMDGIALETLAAQYGLTVARIGVIITSEKNRRTFSAEAPYPAMRQVKD